MAGLIIRIRLRAYDHNLIDEAASKIVETVTRCGVKVGGPIPLPTEKEVVTILRAVQQFELRTHKRLIDIYSPTKAAMTALEKLSLPAGVDIKIKF